MSLFWRVHKSRNRQPVREWFPFRKVTGSGKTQETQSPQGVSEICSSSGGCPPLTLGDCVTVRGISSVVGEKNLGIVGGIDRGQGDTPARSHLQPRPRPVPWVLVCRVARQLAEPGLVSTLACGPAREIGPAAHVHRCTRAAVDGLVSTLMACPGHGLWCALVHTGSVRPWGRTAALARRRGLGIAGRGRPAWPAVEHPCWRAQRIG